MKGAIKEGCQRRMKNACRKRGKKTQTRRSLNTYPTRGREKGHSGLEKKKKKTRNRCSLEASVLQICLVIGLSTSKMAH